MTLINNTKSESPYAACIRVAPSYEPRYDVRHVEAYMRVGHPTLDGLPMWRFSEEVAIAISAIDQGGTIMAEQLAQSFGFMPPRVRGPSDFEVYDTTEWRQGVHRSHGVYDTLDEARGCVEFDSLTLFEIWQGDHIVEQKVAE